MMNFLENHVVRACSYHSFPVWNIKSAKPKNVVLFCQFPHKCWSVLRICPKMMCINFCPFSPNGTLFCPVGPNVEFLILSLILEKLHLCWRKLNIFREKFIERFYIIIIILKIKFECTVAGTISWALAGNKSSFVRMHGDQFTLFLAGGKMRFWMRRT